MKKILLAVAIIMAASQAYARPHLHRHHAAPPAASAFSNPFEAFAALFAPRMVMGRTGLLEVAEHYVGRGNVTGFNGKWCAAFTNKIMSEAGYKHNDSLAAIDKLYDGQRVTNPVPGDLVVMRHHVTIFAGFDKMGRIVGLGGNQNHNVNRRVYTMNRVVAFVRPDRRA